MNSINVFGNFVSSFYFSGLVLILLDGLYGVNNVFLDVDATFEFG